MQCESQRFAFGARNRARYCIWLMNTNAHADKVISMCSLLEASLHKLSTCFGKDMNPFAVGTGNWHLACGLPPRVSERKIAEALFQPRQLWKRGLPCSHHLR